MVAVVERTLMDMESLTPGHSFFPATLLETGDLGVERFHTLPAMAAGVIGRRPITRSEWLVEKEPLEVGSLALVIDSIQPRERWSLALMTAAPLSSDGLQRRVFLRLSSGGQQLERDIGKVVLERDGVKDGVKVKRDGVGGDRHCVRESGDQFIVVSLSSVVSLCIH